MANILSDNIIVRRRAMTTAVNNLLCDKYTQKRKGILIRNQKEAFMYILRTQKELTGYDYKKPELAYNNYRYMKYLQNKPKQTKTNQNKQNNTL